MPTKMTLSVSLTVVSDEVILAAAGNSESVVCNATAGPGSTDILDVVAAFKDVVGEEPGVFSEMERFGEVEGLNKGFAR